MPLTCGSSQTPIMLRTLPTAVSTFTGASIPHAGSNLLSGTPGDLFYSSYLCVLVVLVEEKLE
jgi:hypothetical protein